MSWLSDRLSWLRAPWVSLSELQADVARATAVLVEVRNRLIRVEKLMAADRQLLAEIASGLTALSAPVSDLIASEAALRARVVELEGEAAADEAGDLEAARAVQVAFDDLAGKFTAEPESPDVDPLPESPADPESPPADQPPAAF